MFYSVRRTLKIYFTQKLFDLQYSRPQGLRFFWPRGRRNIATFQMGISENNNGLTIDHFRNIKTKHDLNLTRLQNNL